MQCTNGFYFLDGSSMYLFCYRDTYIEREPGEKVNDRNDRAIRVATAWYASHLFPSQEGERKAARVRVILLTDDAENKVKAENEDLLVTSGNYMYCVLEESCLV